jgi:streptogramin lyase
MLACVLLAASGAQGRPPAPAPAAQRSSVNAFPLPAPALTKSITAGPDGPRWFTEGTRIDRITTGGVVTTYAIWGPVSDGPGGITVGPADAPWFTRGGSGPDRSGGSPPPGP